MSFPSHTALVEFSTSHLECLQAQITFLKQVGGAVDVFLPTEARERASFLTGADSIRYFDVQYGLRGRWRTVMALRRALVGLAVQAVVFNTAEGNHVRDFCLVAPRGMTYAGILHHVDKITRSFTQKLISLRIRRYYVLMDYLLSSLPSTTRCRFVSFSPIVPAAPSPEGPVKPPGEFWVCIPGELEFRRRDYAGLAEAVRRTPPDPAIRFILLGSARTPDGDRFKEAIAKTGAAAQFRLFQGFVDQTVFAGVLSRADVLLPLIHPGISLYSCYRHHQVSGTFLQALSYGRPMMMDRSWAGAVDFDEIALFYDLDNMIPMLNRLSSDGSMLAGIRERFSRAGKFSFAVQQQRYLDLLNGSPRSSAGDGTGSAT